MSQNKLEQKEIVYYLVIDEKYYAYVECYEITSEGEQFNSFTIRGISVNELIAFRYNDDERGTVILDKDIYDKIIEVLKENKNII